MDKKLGVGGGIAQLRRQQRNTGLFKYILLKVKVNKKTLVKCANTLLKVSRKKKLNVVFYDRKLQERGFLQSREGLPY